jgi:hypothetical protein
MIEHSENELQEACSISPYVQTITELKQNDYQEMNKILFKFLDCFASTPS